MSEPDSGFNATLTAGLRTCQITPPLVCQAVRLIIDGALHTATEDDLGARLGVSGRHIRRMFVQHLGLTPYQLARSVRVHFARRLLSRSDLSIADVTFAAGFRSIRQFNRDCQVTFHATPSQLRSRRHSSDWFTADSAPPIRIPVRSHFDWQGWLGWMQKRAIAGVEHVSHHRYRRTIIVDGDQGIIEITPGGADHLVLRVQLQHWTGLIRAVERVRTLLNLDADINAADRHLRGDPLVGPLVKHRPGIRPPGTWDVFETGIEAIVLAQASFADTAAALQKIAWQYGERVPGLGELGLQRTFPAPCAIVDADLDWLGLHRESIAAIRRLARAALDAPAATDPSRGVYGPLIQAIGSPTTVERSALLRLHLGQPDAFPSTSPSLLDALSQRVGRQVTSHEATRFAEAWRPWRAHAAAYLWLADRRESHSQH
jgi:AraC family transcriptional regulator, regulatory protein of adaptative response / DNA-3-methyladenine glycosylase II